MKPTTLPRSIPMPLRPPRLREDQAWCLLQAMAARASGGTPVPEGAVLALDERAGELFEHAADRCAIVARPSLEQGWEPGCAVDDAARELLDLYAPLCVGARSPTLVLAHLGQSLDGRVATVTGASRFVTGPEDVRHTHRLRALFDAVLVGAQTAHVDDPRLTTRLVPGSQPVRVVLDPRARLDPGLQLLCDGAARTIVITVRGARADRRRWGAHVELLELAGQDGQDGQVGVLDPRVVLEALRERGLSRIFVEGGGVTVSRFLQAGTLDRLQLAVAPKILGSGTPALQLLPIDDMADAITARCRRFVLGADLLFDCDLRAEPC